MLDLNGIYFYFRNMWVHIYGEFDTLSLKVSSYDEHDFADEFVGLNNRPS
jgi:hypothetical protein